MGSPAGIPHEVTTLLYASWSIPSWELSQLINANGNMLRPTFHPSGISGLGTQHPLHSPRGHSFLVVSEGRHGRNQTVNSSQHRQISYPFLLFSATRSALPQIVCSSTRDSPWWAATSAYKMSSFVWPIDTATPVRANKTILGAELRNAFSLLYYTSATPSFCETVIPMFLLFPLISPLHLEGQRIWTGPITWTAPFELPFIARLSVLLNITKIPKYSFWLWPAADLLAISGCWTAEKLGRRPQKTPSNRMFCNS